MKEEDLVIEEELAQNLRTVRSKSSDLVRESFDSIYRRGLLESRERLKNIPKRRIPLYKTHTIFSKRDKDDEWENIEKEIGIV
jgi:hypothetical protein